MKTGTSPAKPRKKQRAGGAQGKSFAQAKKAQNGYVFAQCKKVIASKGTKVYVSGKKFHTAAQLYEFLTGTCASGGRKAAKELAGGGEIAVRAPKPKGPAPLTVDAKFEDFYDWVSEKVDNAKKGSYLTLQALKTDLNTEKQVVVSIRVLRRTMKKFGFRYAKRHGVWVSRRQEERIQRRLWAFLEWVVQNSTRTEVSKGREREEDGKFYTYVWNIPVAFEDESFVYDCVFRAASWCKGDDKTLDFAKKGDGVRVNMLHTIFAHLAQQPMQVKTPEHPKALVTWKSSWTGKSHEFSGPTTTGVHMEKYFGTRVFPDMSGGVVCLDGAGNHKEHAQDLKEMDEAETAQLISTKCEGAAKGSYRAWVWKVYQAQEKEAGIFGMGGPALRKFCRTHNLVDTKLFLLAQLFNIRLLYLPQYHPEANPIERFWALLKRYYYDTSNTLPHTTRLREALARIPADYVDKCIQKSLSWCYRRFEAMKKSKKFGGAAVVIGDAEALEDASSDSESESDGD
jgi:transposase